jgi:hypothetical protein
VALLGTELGSPDLTIELARPSLEDVFVAATDGGGDR